MSIYLVLNNSTLVGSYLTKEETLKGLDVLLNNHSNDNWSIQKVKIPQLQSVSPPSVLNYHTPVSDRRESETIEHLQKAIDSIKSQNSATQTPLREFTKFGLPETSTPFVTSELNTISHEGGVYANPFISTDITGALRNLSPTELLIPMQTKVKGNGINENILQEYERQRNQLQSY